MAPQLRCKVEHAGETRSSVECERSLPEHDAAIRSEHLGRHEVDRVVEQLQREARSAAKDRSPETSTIATRSQIARSAPARIISRRVDSGTHRDLARYLLMPGDRTPDVHRVGNLAQASKRLAFGRGEERGALEIDQDEREVDQSVARAGAGARAADA